MPDVRLAYWRLLLVIALYLIQYAESKKTDKCMVKGCVVDSDELRFAMTGDMGGQSAFPYTTDIQVNVARGFVNIDQRHPLDFFLALGDNFYARGVKSVDDTRFQDSFENVYNDSAHMKPWYVILGNHDYIGDVQAQVEYTSRSWRWNMPHLYYTFNYTTSDHVVAQFVMIDTTQLCGGQSPRRLNETVGPSSHIDAEEQWFWIEQQLKKSKAQYLFLVGHYPIWSYGIHGSTACLIKRMTWLMKTYRVTAYLTGHDHNLQHLVYNDYEDGSKPVNVFISGYGSYADIRQRKITDSNVNVEFFYPSKELLEEHLVGSKLNGGFLYASLNKDKCTFAFYDATGRSKLYRISLHPRKFLSKHINSHT